MTLRVLVVASETPDQQDQRRRRSGQASHETYADTLRRIDPTIELTHVCCVVTEGQAMTAERLRTLDGAMFAGSPIQMHEDNDATRAALAFMRRVYEAGLPSFGSCAGLQIATAAAGGSTKVREAGMEVGLARSIVAVGEGRNHPLLDGRPVAWDALAMHSSVVDRHPIGMTVLARTARTPVEVAEIRSAEGVHWGVQYHPELSFDEIADAMRSSADSMLDQGLAKDRKAVENYARLFETIGSDPSRSDLAWQIGISVETTEERLRTREMRNFLKRLRS